MIMGGRRHILHDVIRKSETVTLTVGDKSASKTVVLEEPIDIYLEIDDNPYNSSVHDCSKHIESLRNSVVACNAAEVAHKIASTQQIGKHISKGFLGYITASLDMQNMEECSNVEAIVAELQSQSDELANRKLVMIDDYDILTTRYSAVFENLDRELVQRIHMLMEPCFRFVESSRKEQLRNTDSSLSAMALVGHKEQLDVQARISAITVKQRAAGLIESAKQYLLGQKQLASHIEHVLIGGCKNARWMLPVVVVEKTVAGGSKETEVVMNEQTARMGVNDWKVRQNVQQASMPAMTQEDKQRIGKHLEREIQRLGSSEHEKRVAGMMRKLAGNFLS